jgi:hypothetical protein
MACQQASTGKAPGPDTLPNEVLKFLPKKSHYFIFSLINIMAKSSYTPQKLCTSATKLIYKPNTNVPNILENYRPIALINCILKLLISILTIIGTQAVQSEGIFSDTVDCIRSHINIYDSISTGITMYDESKLYLKKNIYTAYTDFKGAFGGMGHRILFQIRKECGFQDFYINT